ncbi:hypothetical protein AYO44_03625 [Planctomycetaceae bacterium SCGC AG-212-F19]|nr:hypothetical protein AYO44_03625 [Planctomycetaceae bacterium SCGC AG-212-F19]
MGSVTVGRKATASTCWPTEDQELLLRAALLDGPLAIPAWERWQQSVDFEAIDRHSQQVLPLLYHNLNKLGIDGPLIERSKGYYRLTWYKNQLLFHRMAGVLHALHQAGIPTLLLKGAAMAVYYYRNAALRPMEDFDVLVPVDQATAAFDLVRHCGFEPKVPTPAPHGWDLVDAAGKQLDLHRFAFHYARTPDIDDTFWESALACTIDHAATHVLQPTDQLLHICARAFCAPGGSIRWIADALWLLTAFAVDIDWQRLLAEATKRRVMLQLNEAMSYLATRFAAPVPTVVLATLAQRRLSFQEYAAYASALHGDLSHAQSVHVWVNYCVEKVGFSASSGLEFLHYLRERWSAPTLWQLPASGAAKAMRKLGRILAFRPGAHRPRSRPVDGSA